MPITLNKKILSEAMRDITMAIMHRSVFSAMAALSKGIFCGLSFPHTMAASR